MATPSIPARRLAAQQLAAPRFATPARLVAWLGAVQAQDWRGARWAVGVRLAAALGETDVLAAVDAGEVVRTHGFRGTWQLVAAADLRWMLSLVAQRLHDGRGAWRRWLGLDDAVLRRSRAALARALEGGRDLTRAEAAAVLRRARVPTDGPRLSYLLQDGELCGLLCSGPLRGGAASACCAAEPTHALLEERLPAAPRPPGRDAALATLARRFVQSRGPATAADLATWSGLTQADARAGLEGAGRALDREVAGRRTLWHAAGAGTAGAATPAHLLPPFDELFLGYRDRTDLHAAAHARHVAWRNGVIAPLLALDGQLSGTWRRVLGPTEVAIEVTPWRPLRGAAREGVEAAAARYARFLGLAPRLTLRPPAR